MPGIPDYKPGEYLNCGEGAEYSKILVFPGGKCLIKAGHGVGEVITMDEWYFMIGENKATIQNTTRSDKCKTCPLNHTGCYDESCHATQDMESIGKNFMKLRRIPSNNSISSTISYDKYRTVRNSLGPDTYYDTREIIRISPDGSSTNAKCKTRRATMVPVLRADSEISTEADIYDDFSGAGESISQATSEATGEDTGSEDFVVVPGVHVTPSKHKMPWYYTMFVCGLL